ncbi:MAG: histone deacetylase [Actinomycetota bacterium]|nr:histone deacetylase [Actinomycetota bacterium]
MYIIYDDYFLKHNAGAMHPEKSERLSRIMEELSRWDKISELSFIRPEPVQTETLSLVHKTSYINQIKEYSKKEKPVYVDADTVVSPFTYQCALLAAGASVKGIDLICEKKPGQSMFFALVRPPGHHAFSSRGSGFCIFNNIAVAAAYAFKHFGLEKIAIIDFDAHHGNATQDIFYQNKNLFYISFHQYPHYPGTGSWRETGTGQGEGYNLNFPLSAGTGQDCYIFSLYEVVVPLMAQV